MGYVKSLVALLHIQWLHIFKIIGKATQASNRELIRWTYSDLFDVKKPLQVLLNKHQMENISFILSVQGWKKQCMPSRDKTLIHGNISGLFRSGSWRRLFGGSFRGASSSLGRSNTCSPIRNFLQNNILQLAKKQVCWPSDWGPGYDWRDRSC